MLFAHMKLYGRIVKKMTTKTKNILTAVALAAVAISIYVFAVLRVTS